MVFLDMIMSGFWWFSKTIILVIRIFPCAEKHQRFLGWNWWLLFGFIFLKWHSGMNEAINVNSFEIYGIAKVTLPKGVGKD